MTVSISSASQEDLAGILEIERDAIMPPWSHGALLGELYRDDSFFAVASAAGANGSQVPGIDTGYAGAFGVNASGLDTGYAGAFGARASDLDTGCAGLLGFVILRRAADEGELFQIAVNKAVRRHGVADTLMAAALGYAEENALKSVYLEVRGSNDAAIALYKKHGFKPVRQRKDYFAMPVEDAVIMVKEM